MYIRERKLTTNTNRFVFTFSNTKCKWNRSTASSQLYIVFHPRLRTPHIYIFNVQCCSVYFFFFLSFGLFGNICCSLSLSHFCLSHSVFLVRAHEYVLSCRFVPMLCCVCSVYTGAGDTLVRTNNITCYAIVRHGKALIWPHTNSAAAAWQECYSTSVRQARVKIVSTIPNGWLMIPTRHASRDRDGFGRRVWPEPPKSIAIRSIVVLSVVQSVISHTSRWMNAWARRYDIYYNMLSVYVAPTKLCVYSMCDGPIQRIPHVEFDWGFGSLIARLQPHATQFAKNNNKQSTEKHLEQNAVVDMLRKL